MMNTGYLSGIFLLFLILAGSCAGGEAGQSEQKPEPKRLFADFYARHLASDEKSRAEVVLREGVELKSSEGVLLPGGIFFQEGAMEEQNLSEVKRLRYKAERSGGYTGGFDFRFSWPEDSLRHFRMNVPPIIEFSLSDPIKVGEGCELIWTGAPLKQDESLVILLSDQEQRASTIEIAGPTAEARAAIPAEKLTNIQPGPVEYYVVRKKRFNKKEELWEATGTAEYYTLSRKGEVVK
jgi:hypothetical protein